MVQITPQISGTVVAIGADDTQFVKAGQPLVRLDQADAKVALDQAEAQLARTVREVRNLFATTRAIAGRRAAAAVGPGYGAEGPRAPRAAWQAAARSPARSSSTRATRSRPRRAACRRSAATGRRRARASITPRSRIIPTFVTLPRPYATPICITRAPCCRPLCRDLLPGAMSSSANVWARVRR